MKMASDKSKREEAERVRRLQLQVSNFILRFPIFCSETIDNSTLPPYFKKIIDIPMEVFFFYFKLGYMHFIKLLSIFLGRTRSGLRYCIKQSRSCKP